MSQKTAIPEKQPASPAFVIFKPSRAIPPDRFYPVPRMIANDWGVVVYAHPDLLRMLRCVAIAPKPYRPSWAGAMAA